MVGGGWLTTLGLLAYYYLLYIVDGLAILCNSIVYYVILGNIRFYNNNSANKFILSPSVPTTTSPHPHNKRDHRTLTQSTLVHDPTIK